MPDAAPVIVVHGLWMTGLEATLFRHRLGGRGYAVQQFHYRSITAQIGAVLAELRAEVLALGGPVNLVGHSLGGLVLLRLAEEYPELPIGRAVLLGSPVNGSAAARGFARWPGASIFFGSLADSELVAESVRQWHHPAQIGVIAGSHALGFGRFLGALATPNDGTVAVEETRLEGATAQIVLPVSHTGMLVAESVVDATANFLQLGRFSAAGP